jgi:NAD(P)-dependent dehydrogenase (short-subunit alcohol dehydrogenase family)
MRDAGGHVLTMEGAGPGGNATASYVACGPTKRAVPQFVASPSRELAARKVRFHVLSPGTVLPDLLMAGNAADKSTSRSFSILAEASGTVACNLVPRVRALVLANRQRSACVKYLTLPRAILPIAGGFPLEFRANRYFDWSQRLLRWDQYVTRISLRGHSKGAQRKHGPHANTDGEDGDCAGNPWPSSLRMSSLFTDRRVYIRNQS